MNTLSHLHTKLINEAYLFYEALATLQDSLQANVYQFVLSTTLLDYLQEIQILASQTPHCIALQQVCAITIQRLTLLDKQWLTEDNLQELERWPRLVSEGLFWSHDEERLKRLINYLQEDWWTLPLTTEQTDLLLNHWTKHLKNSTATHIETDHKVTTNMTTTELEIETDEFDLAKAVALDSGPVASVLTLEAPTELDLAAPTAEVITAPELETTAEDSSSLLPDLPSATEENITHITDTSPPLQAIEELLDEEINNDDEWQTHSSLTSFPEEANSQDFIMAELLDNDTLSFDNDTLSNDNLPVLADNELDKIIDETTFDALPLAEPVEDSQRLPSTPIADDEEELIADEIEMEEGDLETELAPALPLSQGEPLSDEIFQDHSETTRSPKHVLDPTDSSTDSSTRSPKHALDNGHLSVAAQHSKVLTELSNKVVEINDPLAAALNQFVTAEEESESFLAAIESYTNSIHILWEAAERQNLKGFQEVCTFINDNIFEASSFPHTRKLELRDAFALWPKLLLDYLQSPTKGATVLIEHLGASIWPLPLSENQANTLLVQLIQEAVVPQLGELDNRLFTSSHPTTTAASAPAKPESVRKPAPSPVDKGSEKTPNVFSKTAPSLNAQAAVLPPLEDEEEVTSLDHLAVTMPDWGEAFIEDSVLLASEQQNGEESPWMPTEWQEVVVQRPTPAPTAGKTPETVAQVASSKPVSSHGENKFQTFALPSLEDELLSALDTEDEDQQPSLLPELFGVEMFDDNQKESALNAEKLPLAWSSADSLTDNELAEEDQTALPAEVDSDTVDDTLFWSVATGSPDSTTAKTTMATSMSQDFQLASPHVLDLLKVEISEAQRDLSKALNKLASAEEDSAELLEAIEQYNDNVQSIAEAAKKTGLQGLQEVCTFVNDNLFELSTNARIIRRTAQSHIDTWPRLVLAYLYNPLAGAQELVAHLRNPIWPFALDETRSQTLLAYLTRGVLGAEEEPIEVTVPASVEPKTDEKIKVHQGQVTRDNTPLEEVISTPEDALDNLETGKLKPAHLELTTVASPAITLAPPDVLNLLMGQIHDVQETLSQSLATLVSAPDGDMGLLTAVETYTENVQAIWDAADLAKLEGLQDVCTFINENITAMASQDQIQRLATQELFEAWPSLTIAYLQHPGLSMTKLVQHLHHPDWPSPLTKTQTRMLPQRLLPTLSKTKMEREAKSEDLVIKPDLTMDADTVPMADDLDESLDIEVHAEDSLSAYVLATPENLEILMGQMTDLEEIFSSTLQILCNAETDGDTLLTAVETYTENVQAIWEVADLAKLGGVQDLCTFINDNVTALASKEASDRPVALEVFSAWLPQTIAYLRQPVPEMPKLVSLLQNPSWPLPLDQTQADTLQQRLLPVTTADGLPEAFESVRGEEETPTGTGHGIDSATPVIVLAPADVLEVLIGQIADLEETLASTLQTLCGAEEGSEELLTGVETYTENMQAIWDAADLAKLEGLQDVCTFINDNVTSLASQDAATRKAAQEVFLAWPSLTVAYLRHPARDAVTLVKHLQNSKWPLPLDQTAATALQQRLLPVSQSTIDDGSAQEQEGEIGKSSDIFLAAPDILEVVRGQLIDTIESLSAALEVCVTMDSTNPAFLEAIENYTNQVQTIYDAAEMAGLAGLQEVCTFINDNLMAFSTQELDAKRVAQPYFEKWPAAVLEYLQAPLTGSQSLVQMMQNQAWPTPLEEEAASRLLSLLTRSSEAPTSSATTATEEAEVGLPSQEEEEEEAGGAPAEIGMEVGQEISLGSAEVLGILTEELQSAKEPLAKELQRFTTLNNQDAAFSEAAENYADQIQRLYAAAEMLGLQGLQEVCNFLVDNVKQFSKRDLAARTKAKKVLEAWPDLVLAYLNAPMESVIPMLNHLREPQWAQPLPDDKAHELLNLLTQGSTGETAIDEAPAYSRPTEAKPEEVSLQIPGDVNRELLAAYLEEVPQHATDFSALIQKIIRDPQIPDIQHAQRVAHTLKGSSRILGIVGIANVAHHLEDTLEYLAQHQVVPPKELTDTMVEAADCIELMVDTLLGQGEAPPQALQVLQSVLDWANRIDKGNLQAPSGSARPASAPKTAAPAAEKKAEAATKPAEGAPAGDAAAVAGTLEQTLKVPTKTVDNLMRLVGELSISLGQIQERLKHVLQSTRVLTDQNMILQQRTFALENLVDVRGVTGVVQSRYGHAEADDQGFDALEFEEYNELHSVAHSFIESIADNRELAMSIRNDLAELETMFIHQQRLNKEFEASVMTTRMVPVHTILSKLQRNVKQTCRTTNKKADLNVSGTDILIDSDVLTNLAEPLQHILRNAIDHGLEAPDERVLLGKSETGQIHLSFYREGNNVVVKCQDDGQGLNYTNIRYTAIQRGLLKEGQEVTEPELARFILMSGFSTKSGVTQVSGRGVGMDVVHTSIRQMKGTLDLVSQTGKGMTLLIKLPMTLVTVHVLLVRVGHRMFGIPTNNLEQVLAHGVGEYQKVGGEITFKMGKNFYAIKSLSLLLNEPSDRGVVEEDDPRPVVLVHEETGITAVLVDELIDTHDLVMKSMGQYLKHIHGVAGAAILGDGSVVPLLDLPELLRSPMQATLSASISASVQAGEVMMVPTAGGIPNILIVDDSLSVRKSLSILMEDAGFETSLAKDGLEAIEVMNQKRPNVILVDMEMPRMNGLEFTSHVRANQTTQNLPIFMITSRTTEKHREQAKNAGVSAYLTKPYQDTELLGLIDKALTGKG